MSFGEACYIAHSESLKETSKKKEHMLGGGDEHGKDYNVSRLGS